MNCPIGKRMLLDYHHGKLRFEDYKAINQHLAKCETCATKLDEMINQTEKVANSPKLPNGLKSVLFLAIIAICLFVAIYSGYLALFKDEVDEEMMEVVEADDIGIVEEHQIDFTLIEADVNEDRTIVYFEIKDLDNEHHYFFEHYRFSYSESLVGPFTKSEEIPMVTEASGVSKGELHLVPILGDKDEIVIQLYEVFRLNDTEIEPFSKEWHSKENRTYIHGEWEYRIVIERNDTSITLSGG